MIAWTATTFAWTGQHCALGVAIAGLYAVAGSLFLGVPIAAPLRWAVLPLAPVAAVVVAVVTARLGRVPVQGWDGFLAFPLSSVLAARPAWCCCSTRRRPTGGRTWCCSSTPPGASVGC